MIEFFSYIMHGYEDIPSLTEFSFPSTGDDVSDDTTTLEEVISARFCLRTFCCHRSLAISCVCFFSALVMASLMVWIFLWRCAAHASATPIPSCFRHHIWNQWPPSRFSTNHRSSADISCILEPAWISIHRDHSFWQIHQSITKMLVRD